MDGIRKGKTDNPLEQFITIELFGQPYTFKAEEEVSRAKEVADFFVEEVNKVEVQMSDKISNVTKNTILILAALNIANENYELKKNHSVLLRDISERYVNLIRTLDTGIQ